MTADDEVDDSDLTLVITVVAVVDVDLRQVSHSLTHFFLHLIFPTWTKPFSHLCSVLGESHLGAKRDFEIWAFKVFSLNTKSTP